MLSTYWLTLVCFTNQGTNEILRMYISLTGIGHAAEYLKDAVRYVIIDYHAIRE